LSSLTIILATLNRPTLEDSLKSIRIQSIPSLRVLYVTTPHFRNEIESLHKRIMPNTDYQIFTTDLKLYGSLNLGLKNTDSDFVSFLHDDDWLGSNFFDKSLRLLEDNPEINWCFGDVWRVQENGIVEHLEADPYYFVGLELAPPRIWHPAAVYRKKLFHVDMVGQYRIEINKIDLKIASDYDWFLRAEKLNLRGTKVTDIEYFMRTGGLSWINHELSISESMVIVADLFPHSGIISQKWLLTYGHIFKNNSKFVAFTHSIVKFVPKFLRSLLKNRFTRHLAIKSLTIK
jgi:glycosyltransferase involved in cell wall biosynthesis